MEKTRSSWGTFDAWMLTIDTNEGLKQYRDDSQTPHFHIGQHVKVEVAPDGKVVRVYPADAESTHATGGGWSWPIITKLLGPAG